jgi:hypothetical protein
MTDKQFRELLMYLRPEEEKGDIENAKDPDADEVKRRFSAVFLDMLQQSRRR